jgi:hypothetical protein
VKQYFKKHDRWIDVDVSNNDGRKPVEAGFTILPETWERKIWSSKHRGIVYPVATYLLRQGRMTNWQPVKVTNVAMRVRNIDGWAKMDALAELEALGLIKVWKGGGKRSPVVAFRVRG